MASPAGASPLLRPVDPSRKGHYTIHLSDAISGSGGSQGSFASVRFNHKPKQTGAQRKTTISSSEKGQQYNLTIKDNVDRKTERYTYKGQRTASPSSYVLIFDPSKQTCTLEPLSAAYGFNLTSAPWESSASKLAQQYPQIQLQKEQINTGGDDLFGEADEGVGAGAGDDSPYDFRNFLQRDGSMSPPDILTGSATNTPRAEASRSTPLVKSREPAMPTSKKGHGAKSKAAAARKPDPLPSGTLKKPQTPSILLERHTSSRPSQKARKKPSPKPSPEPEPAPAPAPAPEPEPELELQFSEDELVIEHEEPSRPERKPKSLGLALREAQGGPISLRSAANSASPSSRLHTPLHSRTQQEDDDDVIDFGDAPADGDGFDDGYGEDDDYMDADVDLIVNPEPDVDADGDADIDVEPMDIGPPAHDPVQWPPEMRIEDDDDDADFEAEMMEGLAESESESEEE